MNKYIKRIQAKLSYNGVKVSQPDIKEVYKQLVKDIENPTQEEMDTVTDKFLNGNNSEMVNHSTADSGSPEPQELTLEDQTIDNVVDDSTQESSTEDTALTFDNNFQKAGAIQQVFNDNGIVASDVEMLQMSNSIENTFDNEQAFIIQALTAWENYQLANIEKQRDEVDNKLASIRTNEVVAANQMSESMNATAKFVNDIRARHRENFQQFINGVTKS